MIFSNHFETAPIFLYEETFTPILIATMIPPSPGKQSLHSETSGTGRQRKKHIRGTISEAPYGASVPNRMRLSPLCMTVFGRKK